MSTPASSPQDAGYRNRPNRDFTIIRNRMLQDENLSLKAKGLLAMMLSFPPNWVYHAKHLQQLSTDGRDSLRTGLQELEAAGYISRTQTRDEAGRLSSTAYWVTDSPSTVDGFPGDGLSGDGKPAPINTYRNKTYRKKDEEAGNAEPGTPMPARQNVAASFPKDEALSRALADPDSAEARAFLAANGINTDQRPVWELKTFLRRNLGSQAEHPQVQANITAWAAQHNLVAVREAWSQAVARHKREPHGRLRAVHYFCDILNGTYKPDRTDLEDTRARLAEQAPPSFSPGDEVITASGEVLTVLDYDEAGQWLVFDNRPPLRPTVVRRA